MGFSVGRAEARQSTCLAAMALWATPGEVVRQALRGALPWERGHRPFSGCLSPCAQVPVIPVVYSSFSSFYNPRTKHFTSGSAQAPHRIPFPLLGLPWARPCHAVTTGGGGRDGGREGGRNLESRGA